MTSLLESANTNGTVSTEPQLNFDFDFNPLLNLPTSPLSSDTSNSPLYSNQANSPGSFTSGSDGLGDSPVTTSPSPYMMEPFPSSLGMSEPTLDALITSTAVDPLSGSNVDLSAEVKIDVGKLLLYSYRIAGKFRRVLFSLRRAPKRKFKHKNLDSTLL